MKIPYGDLANSIQTLRRLKANAGPLTNFEVLEFLLSRGAGKDPTRVIAPIAPSEFKIVEDLDRRIEDDAEELVDMVLQVFPPPPTQMESDEGVGEDDVQPPEAS